MVQEEWLVALGHLLDEVFRVGCELVVALGNGVDGKLFQVLDLLPFDCMHEMMVEVFGLGKGLALRTQGPLRAT